MEFRLSKSGAIGGSPRNDILILLTARPRQYDQVMSVAVANLPSCDLSVAKRFYVDTLGFAVIFESTEDGHTGLIGLERGGMRINIDSPMDGHGRRACVSLEVDDVDVLYQEWSSRLTALQPPQDQPWGARTFGFQDPDDNTVFVLGPSN